MTTVLQTIVSLIYQTLNDGYYANAAPTISGPKDYIPLYITLYFTSSFSVSFKAINQCNSHIFRSFLPYWLEKFV